NPFGLALDCYAGAPQRIEPPPTPPQAGAPANASGHLQGDSP
ncbi:MAG: TIGR03746 family integrating conjugative element protein, partial [Gammaproteobacteria bacterium]